MFDVGFWELTFLATLALLVLGPDKLPGVVTSVGRMLGRARSLARGLKMQIEREMNETAAGGTGPGAPDTARKHSGDFETPSTGKTAAGPDAGPQADATPDPHKPDADETAASADDKEPATER